MNYIIASNRKIYKKKITIVNPAQLADYLLRHNPKVIFFPFWSWKVPKEIIKKYQCVGFHCGNLPFDKGGSPIQNLIRRGRKTVDLCAFKMNDEIDGGEVIMRKKISLNNNLEDIVRKIGKVISLMIDEMVKPFKRIVDNEIKVSCLEQFYDEIRMRDENSHPKSFIYLKKFKIEFKRAALRNGYIETDAKIFETNG